MANRTLEIGDVVEIVRSDFNWDADPEGIMEQMIGRRVTISDIRQTDITTINFLERHPNDLKVYQYRNVELPIISKNTSIRPNNHVVIIKNNSIYHEQVGRVITNTIMRDLFLVQTQDGLRHQFAAQCIKKYNDEHHIEEAVPIKKEQMKKEFNQESMKYFKYIPLKIGGNFVLLDLKSKKAFYPKIGGRQDFKIVHDVDESTYLKYYYPEIINQLCKFRVRDYKTSAKLFGLAAKKSQMVGKMVDVHTIEFDATVAKSEIPVNTIYVTYEGGNLRMCLDDIEIIYPNINGYNPRKDKRLVKRNSRGKLEGVLVREGEQLLVYNSKKVKNTVYRETIIVHEIKIIGNNVFIGYIKEGKLEFSNIKNFRKLENVNSKETTIKKKIVKKQSTTREGILSQIQSSNSLMYQEYDEETRKNIAREMQAYIKEYQSKF